MVMKMEERKMLGILLFLIMKMEERKMLGILLFLIDYLLCLDHDHLSSLFLMMIDFRLFFLS